MSASGGILAHESGLLLLDLSRRELRASGVSVPIGGRAFEILAILAQSGEELVSKDELMRRVWPGAIVEENTLQAQIAAIRRALGADRNSLKTVSGRGYRLIGKWSPQAATGSTPAAERRANSRRRHASLTHQSAGQADRSDRARLCRPSPGTGPHRSTIGDVDRPGRYRQDGSGAASRPRRFHELAR